MGVVDALVVGWCRKERDRFCGDNDDDDYNNDNDDDKYDKYLKN